MREDDNVLVIRTRRDTEVLELIPHEKFAGDIPTLLKDEYVHWLDLSSGDAELRPLRDLWTSSQDNWWIRSFLHGSPVMCRGSCRLVDIRSPTFSMISSRLSPLEYATYLTISYPSPELLVELPRFRLSFFLNDNDQLESRNLPGMEVDENQSTGTMFGLVNQMILRANTSIAPGHPPSRYVLIPFGKVDCKQQGFHTSITIDTASKRDVVYHKYRIDCVLGRLMSNVSLASKLYKVLLHAVSSHCLPDPLTGLTGTEEALNELRSASCRSFQTLTTVDIKVLQQISSLPPNRQFYPPHKRAMQVVQWSQLPAIAHHDGYWVVAKQILEHANRLRAIQGKSDGNDRLSDTNTHLLERAARRNAIYYPAHFRNLLPSASDDVEYTSRDQNLDGEASACDLSTMVKAWSMNAHTSFPLFDVINQWSVVSGPQHRLKLSYSRKWLDLDLPTAWMSLYNLCRGSNKLENRWQLAFSLCAFQYSAPHHSHLARVLLAFATIPRFRLLDPPPWTSYDLSHGYEAQESVLSGFCRLYTIPYENSPAIHLPRQLQEDDAQLGRRRYSHYETKCNEEVSRIVNTLMPQWPCEIPSQPSTTYSSSFVNIPQLMQAVRSRFQSWYHNMQLRDHLKQVQLGLDEHSLRGSHHSVPVYAFIPCLQKPPSMLSYVSYEHLFIRPAPEPTRPPAVLGIDSISTGNSSGLVDSGTTISPPSRSQPPSAALQSILVEFQSNDANVFHRLYGNSLMASQQALSAQVSDFIADYIPISLDILVQNREQWAIYVRHVLESICQSLRPSPSNRPESALLVAGLWPRLTIQSLLAKLTYPSFHDLPKSWQLVLTSLAKSLLSLQRASRLAALAQSHSHDDFWKELRNSGIDAMLEPDWILIQVRPSPPTQDILIDILCQGG